MYKDLSLIVMLTYNDRTVENACDIFEKCKDSKALYWGLKEIGLPQNEMKKLCAYMKKCAKTAVLEVVAYDEDDCLNGAKTAVECGFDILMGTVFYDSVNDYCRKHDLKYMPFVGKVHDRPSVLEGSAEEMIEQAKKCLEKGVYGIDLLAYRYTYDPDDLIQKFVTQIDAPVCIAGSIDSYACIDAVKSSGVWAFTVGSAFFDNRFEGSFAEQIDKVYDYIHGVGKQVKNAEKVFSV